MSSDLALKLAGLRQMKVVSLWSVNIQMIALHCTQLEQLKAWLRYVFDSNTVKGHDLKASKIQSSTLQCKQFFSLASRQNNTWSRKKWVWWKCVGTGPFYFCDYGGVSPSSRNKASDQTRGQGASCSHGHVLARWALRLPVVVPNGCWAAIPSLLHRCGPAARQGSIECSHLNFWEWYQQNRQWCMQSSLLFSEVKVVRRELKELLPGKS